MERIRRAIESFCPINEQEQRDKEIILKWIAGGADILTRENEAAHLTVSAWVVNQGRDKVLMAYHNIYDSWAWLGGHADGEKDLLRTALKEAEEESGIKGIYPLSSDIFSLEVLSVDGHEKKGRYVSSHLHLNVTYILEASEEDELKIKPDENKGVAWMHFNDIKNRSSEPWYVERIYSKLIKKTHLL